MHGNNISSVAYTIGPIESILKGKWYTFFNLSLKSNFTLKIEFLLNSYWQKHYSKFKISHNLSLKIMKSPS